MLFAITFTFDYFALRIISRRTGRKLAKIIFGLATANSYGKQLVE